MNFRGNASERYRPFKLLIVPLMIFSLVAQLAVIWTQRESIRNGLFDFVLYYSGAKIIADGKGSQLYDLPLQNQYQTPIRGHRDRDLPFNHLPYELLPLVFLAKFFSFPVAHAVWAAVNILLLTLVLIRISPFIAAQHRGLVALMTLGYFPTLTALKMGQDSIVTTYLLVETLVSLKRKRYFNAGAVLALGLYKPQFVLPLAGILLMHRRWPAIWGFLAMGLLLVAISTTMVGWSGLMGLVSLWLPMIERGHVVWPELMINLRGLIYVTLDLAAFSQVSNEATLAFSLVIYGLTLRLWRRETEESSDLFDLCFALSIVTTALISFHLYSYDGTLLLIPLILMLDRVLRQTAASSLRQRAFFAVITAWFIPLVPNVLLSAAALAWWTLPLPVLFGIIAREIRSRTQASR